MATISSRVKRGRKEVPELHSGDRMTQPEFHRIYEQMPENFRAELIGGVVYVSSPLKRSHGGLHMYLSALFAGYEGNTPGVEAGDNVTVLLGRHGETQPDLYLRILPDHGGQSWDTENEYIGGAPELVAEVAHSSRSVDLNAKKDDYARYGVLEYLVLSIKDKHLHWFDLRANQELQPDGDGVYRLRAFPGLWIHGAALLDKNFKKMMATLEQGLVAPEHAAFVKKLGQARKKK